MRFCIAAIVLALTATELTGSPFDGLLKTFRADRGLSVPRQDESLSATCRSRAAELATAGELVHVKDGQGPGLQAMAAGMPPGEYGEVLGSGPSATDVWAAWLASPAHREVLLSVGWKSWGWGSASLGEITVYVVRFWKP